MAIDKKIETAWKSCEFCSREDDEIYGMIVDQDRWKDLPLSYKCAWKRISQVAFRRQLQWKPIWSSLCHERARENNEPGFDWQPSDWTEGWCDTYLRLYPKERW